MSASTLQPIAAARSLSAAPRISLHASTRSSVDREIIPRPIRATIPRRGAHRPRRQMFEARAPSTHAATWAHSRRSGRSPCAVDESRSPRFASRAVNAIADLAAIRRRDLAGDEPLGDEAVAHSRRGRADARRARRRRRRVERAATGEDNQGAELRHGHITVDADQRTRRNRHQDPRSVQHRIDDVTDLAAIRSFLESRRDRRGP